MGTLEQTVEQLRQAARDSDDASGHFPAMYAAVTAEVVARLQLPAGDGGFEDAARMERLSVLFADLYLDPHAGRQPVPRCWQACRDVAREPRLLVVQHLLLGMNAHINHDLPQAVVALADETGDLPALRADFDAVNAVLASAYATVLHRLGLATRWVNRVAAFGGERLFRFSLTAARSQAWGAAERMHALDRAGRRRYVGELDGLVSVLAYLVAFPPWPLSWLARGARRLEEQDPRRVTALLLGETARPRAGGVGGRG